MRNRTLLALLLSSVAAAAPSTPPLHYQTGKISLLGGKATLDTGRTLRFLNATDARRVLVDSWGNPPEAASDVAGMIVPVTLDPEAETGWAVVITESQDGHVSDEDASHINYDSLMRDMQAAAHEGNAEREQAGYGTVDVIGWADRPSYDAATHKMYWAKELAFNDSPEHTLNYAVRLLGRDNVLELNAVAGMTQLPQIRQDMAAVLQQVSFNAGYRYEDYDASTDRLATYGIAGLLGVTAAKKAGLLAMLFLFLKKGWVLALAALGGLGRIFTRKNGDA